MALPIAVDLLAPDLDLDSDMSVDEVSVALLSATQLLLASANTQLPVLVRQRAYAIYTTRKMVAESGMTGTVRADEYMLVLDHDFDLSDLTTLTPIQLLLTPFNPKATSTLADAAYSRFKALRQRSKRAAREAELDGDSQPLSHLRAFSITLVHDEITQSETEGLELHVLSDCLSIRQSAESQVAEVCRIPGARMSDFCYIAGNPQPAGLPCTLKVAAAFALHGRRVSGTATVALGPLLTEDKAFVALRRSVREWSKAHGFPLRAEDTPSEPERKPKVEVETSERKHSRVEEPYDPPPSAQLERRVSKSRRTSRSTSPARRSSHPRHLESPSRALLPIFSLLTTIPNDVQWTPAFYTRQSALLRSIDMRADLGLPTFSAEELVLLSFRPSAGKLPELDRLTDRSARYSSEDRLAVERIYKDRGFVEIEQTRWLITCGADSMPDLRRYVAMVAKLVKCRDAFNVAWSSLKEVLESRRKDKGTVDPIDALIELASKLATRESLRLELFSDGRETATKKNKLDKDKFGVGPWRRYDAALKLLLEFEADARKQFTR